VIAKRPERQLRRLLACAALPGFLAAGLLLLLPGLSPPAGGAVAVAMLTISLVAAHLTMRRLRFFLRTIANLISGLREGDYSFRARTVPPGDVWHELIVEVNLLADRLRSERLGEREAAGLLRNVMEEIPLGVFTFDPARKLRFVNPAGERMLVRDQRSLLGRSAADLGLSECLEGAAYRNLNLNVGPTFGRWALRRTTVRQEGHPYQLVVLSDLSKALREEERLAWQRIVRVLGHEVNNSLAPIQSIAASLEKLLGAASRAEDWERDAREGLAVIRGRSESLNRFMQAYAHLARLPAPRLQQVDVSDWIHQNASLETRLAVRVLPGPKAGVHADRAQLDQLLINLIRNAADAALGDAGDSIPNATAHKPDVTIAWRVAEPYLVVTVEDNGPGVVTSENLFVPFYTTKSGGSGIGLALCRQIAEAHEGLVSLDNRADAPGAVATLRLPIQSRDPSSATHG
jgi:nitrogen fixation/metabolism regulation signal transduction histidine kinase